MIIREMKKEDNAIVKEIIQNSLESLGLAKPGTAYFDPQLNDLHDYYSNLDHAKYWVVEVREEVVGGIGIAPFNKDEKICELQKLYVRTNVQGLGIGKKLMETALSFASQHYDKCYLETTKELKTACVLYDKFGFTLLQEPLPGSEHSAMDAWYLKQLTPKGA
ncbi:GNAT family N-acetyltransferase [Sutcliffiella horikoshii]|uniref:GNAT family N-acetyltransferase n=1 Tax=Sutcliffiella horikoshii TaxID=79883 RepID=UPI001F3DE319|nr:GNAT family N-acetyltransferase [Sutcliffiella horikoshii]MCG1022749.1 GNAT family N-acetyltransferase [Sutcliffiella horikoshii]